MNEKNTLQSWAIQADTIAKLNCSHQYRDFLIIGLLTQCQQYQKITPPLWLIILIDLLDKALIDNTLTHTEVKALLAIFKETCYYFTTNLQESWMAHARIAYDHAGNPVQNDDDPFASWFNQDDDDIPM